MNTHLKSVNKQQSRPMSLRSNFSWSLTGTLIYNFCLWGLIATITKISSPELLGHYGLALAIATPIFMFSNLNLGIVLTSDTTQHHQFSDYVGLRVILSILAFVLLLAMAVFSNYGDQMRTLLLLVTISKFIESLSEIIYALLRQHERFEYVAVSMILRGIISLGLSIVILTATGSLPLALILQAMTWLAVLVFFDLRNAAHWENVWPTFQLPVLSTLFMMALPVGVVGGLNSLSTQAPRYFVEHFLSASELGIFVAIGALGIAGQLIATALSQTILPRLAKLFVQHKLRQFLVLLLRVIVIGFGLSIAGVVSAYLFGEPLLAVLYTAEYTAYKDLLVLVAMHVGLVMIANFIGTALSATQSFRVQSYIHVVKLAAIIIGSLLFIPRYGLNGAVLASIFGLLVSATIYAWALLNVIAQTSAKLEMASD